MTNNINVIQQMEGIVELKLMVFYSFNSLRPSNAYMRR